MSAHRTLVRKRRDAAEQVCWCLLLMMGLGELELPQASRDWLFDAYRPWADLAVETGIMTEGDG